MRIQVKDIGHEAIALLKKAVWNVKQAHEHFCDAYCAAFAAACGKDWKETWQQWDDFAGIVEEVEEQIKAVCLDSGMGKHLWHKYKGGARNVAWYGIDFKFRTANHKHIQQAKRLAEEMEGEQAYEKKLNQAVAIVRQEERDKWAKNSALRTAKKANCLILNLPKDNEDLTEYVRTTANKIKVFLDSPEIKGAIATSIVKALESKDKPPLPAAVRASKF